MEANTEQTQFNNFDPKTVKKVQGEVPFGDLITYDVSLKAKSFKEDEIFAGNTELRKTVRRGLSYLGKKDSPNVAILRRGLEKFFDLRIDYFEVLLGTSALESLKIKEVEKQLYHVIFDDVEEAFKAGRKVLVYKTEKANGENCQISYNKEHDAWVVASKNVSILIRDKKDLDVYRNSTEGRYPYAVMMADTWFKLLETKVTNVEELKKDLDGRTLIGEYCGHPNLEHLVRYDEITIYFYASVELRGTNRSCNPIGWTKNLLEKHGLPIVKIEMRRECANKGELVEILKELFKEVSENTIEQDAEGSVVYFEAKQEGEKGAEILSLAKLKTLEYRLFRKLREKLKNLIARRIKEKQGKSVKDAKTSGELLKIYEKEAKSLIGEYTLPLSEKYYYEVAELGMKFVEENIDGATTLGLSSRFLTFLTILRECKEKGVKPTLAHFKVMTENPVDDDSDPEGEKDF